MNDITTHVDKKWIEKKINGHGGGYTFDSIDGLCKITFIGNKNKLQVAYYNFILFLKYLLRNIRK